MGDIGTGTDLHTALEAIYSAVTGALQRFWKITMSGVGPFSRSTINFVEGTNVTITVTDVAISDRVDVEIASTGGGGGGGWDTQTDGVSLETGRHYIFSTDLADFVYLGGAGNGIEVNADDSELFLVAGGDEPIVMDAANGVVLPSNTSEPVNGIYDDGHAYVDGRDTLHFLRMAQPDVQFTPEVWLHQGFPSSGWSPVVFPLGFDQTATYTTVRTLGAQGTIALPFLLTAPMELQTINFWNTDSTLVREWEVAVWHQPFQDNSTTDKLLAKVPGSQNFGGGGTVSSAGLRSTPYSSGTCYVPAGVVWVTLKNIHASNSLGVGYVAGSAQMAVNLAQSKTLASNSFDGDTLDFVAATWTKLTDIHAIALHGAVFGGTSW